jgi:hypothetical protein
MDTNQSNSSSKPDKETAWGDTAVEKAGQTSHFKRNLVPLDEYAAQQGISSDIVEQQGQLGVIQIRKFKGQKFVVDVPAEQLSEFENEDTAETTRKTFVRGITTSSKILTIGLVAGIMIIVISVFWLYMDARTKIDDLNAENKSMQSRINDLTSANQDLKVIQEKLVAAKTEFIRIQNRIATSRSDMEKIQGDLNKTRRNLEAIQSEFTTMQGQMSLSKVELESIQNSLNENRNQLDSLYKQNSAVGPK